MAELWDGIQVVKSDKARSKAEQSQSNLAKTSSNIQWWMENNSDKLQYGKHTPSLQIDI